MERQLSIICNRQNSSTCIFDFQEVFVAVILSFTWILSSKCVITSLHSIYRITPNGLLCTYNLNKLKIENSNLVMEFREGAFGVRRTKSCLGRSPVDLTLEQTINAHAGNTWTGVSHFTDSISARQRWALSHSMRTKILSVVKAEIGLSQADDTSHSLQNSRIEKENKTFSSIIETIKKTMNPFSENLD